MKKRGFTLIEILSVLVVLSLLLAIAVPAINKYLDQSKEKSYRVQINSLLDAAESYANMNTSILPSNEDEIIRITLGQLKAEGLVKGDIKNPNNDKSFDDSMIFLITKKGNSYAYEIDSDTITTRKVVGDSPTIKLTGEVVTYYGVDEEYFEEGCVAYNSKGISLDNVDIDTSHLDMTTPGIYYVKYTASDENNITTVVYRNIVVR